MNNFPPPVNLEVFFPVEKGFVLFPMRGIFFFFPLVPLAFYRVLKILEGVIA
jgi:hypothetical protein